MAALLEAVHVVRTPEQVEFEFPLAGPTVRLLAWAIDGVLIGAAIIAVSVLLLFLDFTVAGLGTALILVAVFLINWGYFVACETLLSGQTLGKRALGLRVLQDTGVRIGFAQSALRNLLRAVDHLPALYLVGGISALLSEEGKRLGDHVAGTIVVRERRRRIPAAVASAAGVADGAALTRLRAKVRPRATPAERELLVAAALRRDELSLGARLLVFGELAAVCTERLGVERPPHLSEEKFVLQVALALLVEEPRPLAGREPLRRGAAG